MFSRKHKTPEPSDFIFFRLQRFGLIVILSVINHPLNITTWLTCLNGRMAPLIRRVSAAMPAIPSLCASLSWRMACGWVHVWPPQHTLLLASGCELWRIIREPLPDDEVVIRTGGIVAKCDCCSCCCCWCCCCETSITCLGAPQPGLRKPPPPCADALRTLSLDTDRAICSSEGTDEGVVEARRSHERHARHLWMVVTRGGGGKAIVRCAGLAAVLLDLETEIFGGACCCSSMSAGTDRIWFRSSSSSMPLLSSEVPARVEVSEASERDINDEVYRHTVCDQR